MPPIQANPIRHILLLPNSKNKENVVEITWRIDSQVLRVGLDCRICSTFWQGPVGEGGIAGGASTGAATGAAGSTCTPARYPISFPAFTLLKILG